MQGHREKIVKTKTYDEWLSIGFQVRKGEVSTDRNLTGFPTFTRDQVDEAPRFDRGRCQDWDTYCGD